MAGGKYAKPIDKRKLLIKVLAVIAAILVVLVVALVCVYNDVLNNIRRFDGNQETMSPEEYAAMMATAEGAELDATTPTVEEPENFDVVGEDEELIGGEIINIMLVGQDTRDAEKRGLSDTMILVSINRETKKLVLTSFIRDLYIDIVGLSGKGTYRDRLNTAYCTGGIEQLGNTLAYNFGVEIDNFVEVDFSAFQKIIDALGGVDIEITAAEANYMNTYKEFIPYKWSLVEGMNHLDGKQTLAYARIRKLDSDWNRTARQRKLLGVLFEKVKDMSISDMMDLAEEFLPMITTDMTNGDITKYIIQVAPILKDLEIESIRIPEDGTWGGKNVGTEEAPKNVIMCVNLARNRELLRQTIGVESVGETTAPSATN